MATYRSLLGSASALALAASLSAPLDRADAAVVVPASSASDVATAISDANSGQTVTLAVTPGAIIDLSAITLPAYTAGSLSLGDQIGSISHYSFAGTLSGGSITFDQTLGVYLQNNNLSAPYRVAANGTISTSLQGSGALVVGGFVDLYSGNYFAVAPTLFLSGANSFTGGVSLASFAGPVQVEFVNPGALPATGQIGTGFAAETGYAIDQAFLTHFVGSGGPGGSAALGADSANPLDFSAGNVGQDLSLGAINGTWTYSGALTPANANGPSGGTYRFGGGNGTLIVSSILSDGATANSVQQGQADGYGHISLGGFTVLTGANTYSGGTTILAGTLEFQSAGSFPAIGAVTLAQQGGVVAFGFDFDQSVVDRLVVGAPVTPPAGTGYGTLALAADNANPLDFTNQPNLSLGSEGAFTYSGVLTPGAGGYILGGGTGALTMSSALSGALPLSVNYVMGGSEPSGGVIGRTEPVQSVILTNANAGFSGTVAIDFGVLQLGNGVVNGGLGSASSITTAGFTALNQSAILAFDEPTAISFSIPISGAAVVEQDGPGAVTLTSAESYSGMTYIKSGALVLGATGSLSSGDPVLIGAGGTLDISAAGPVTLGRSTGRPAGRSIWAATPSPSRAQTVACRRSPASTTAVSPSTPRPPQRWLARRKTISLPISETSPVPLSAREA